MMFISEEHYNVFMGYYLSNIYLTLKCLINYSSFDTGFILFILMNIMTLYFLKMVLFIDEFNMMKFQILGVSLLFICEIYSYL